MATSPQLVVGVLGGMGPEATIDFMAEVLAATPATEDQDHLRLLVDQNPQLPSRQLALAGAGESPGPQLAAMAQGLEQGGADFLVMPCNTAHAYRDDIVAATSIPLVSIIDETVAECGGLASIGLLATVGCLNAGVFQAAFAATGQSLILPTAGELEEFTRLVAAIKIGNRTDELRMAMQRLADALVGRGAQAIVAGCTEIPLVLDESMLDVPLISSTAALAKSTVAIALGNRSLG
ncbi:MAG: amino acid racemase [Gammaproteobacteria bacterium]|nr:amino acid racemase [Gammaproteobacteria bacterium]